MNHSFFMELLDADDLPKLYRVVDCRVRNHSLFVHDGDMPEFLRKHGIVCYGAGRFAGAVIKSWRSLDLSPRYCVDSNRLLWGTTIQDIPVLQPDVLFHDPARPLAVIAAMQTHQIESVLTENDIPFLYSEHDGSMGYTPGHWLYQHWGALEAVYEALGDDSSRSVLLAVVKARIFQNFNFPMRGNFFTSEIAVFPQYFPDDLFSFQEGEMLIDCGAFDGDTLVSFAAAMRRAGVAQWRAMAFEPDPNNIELIKSNLKKTGIDNAMIINAAVGGCNKTANLTDYFNCRSQQDDHSVDVVTLDSALAKIKPALIKMDVEGDEISVLEGAFQTITNHHPKIAVCVYHKSHHLIDIPLFFMKHFSGYKLYLRHHSPGTLWETVLYASPG